MARKNLKALKERMKKLQQQMREVEKSFYIEFAKQVEKELQSESCTVESIKEIYEKLRKEYAL